MLKTWSRLTDQFLRFHVNQGIFAVSIAKVDKVIRTRQIKKIKKSPRYVVGTTKIEAGKILVINLRRIFNFGDDSESTLAIMADLNGKKVAFQVDKIDGVFRYQEISKPPPGVKTPRFYTGIIVDNEQIIQIVEFSKIFAKKEQTVLSRILKEAE